MKIFVQNTTGGLVPMYDEDYDNKKKLKLDEVYKVDIVKARNYQFHKKYFSLINTAWEYLNENQQAYFSNKEGFRSSVQNAAGHCKRIYSIARNEWIEETKSIEFEKMDEFEFRELYTDVRNVIFKLLEGNVSEQEFIMNLSDY